MLKSFYFLNTLILLVYSCSSSSEKNNTEDKPSSANENVTLQPDNNKSKIISDLAQRKIVYEELVKLLSGKIPNNKLQDSVIFFLIPVDAACPHCRDKSTKAVAAHLNKLRSNQYIIFSAKGLKPIKAYFKGMELIMPEEEGGNIFYDSDNEAFINDLIFMNPCMYYCFKGEAYEKVVSYPLNIDEHLKIFFKD